MPLVSYDSPFISLPVADRQLAGLQIPQLAVFRAFHHVQASNRKASLTVELDVYMCTSAPDGTLVPTPDPPRAFQLGGNDLTLVDAATGAILAIRENELNEAWQAVIESFPQPTMLQGEYFLRMRDTEAVPIAELIRHHIQQASAMGRFA